MKHCLKLTALILSLAISVTALAGCSIFSRTLEDVERLTVEQVDMPSDQLAKAMKRIEYSALASGFANQELQRDMTYADYDYTPAAVHDIDGDGVEDFVASYGSLLFRDNGTLSVELMFSQFSYEYTVDKDGNFYFYEVGGDSHDDEQGYHEAWFKRYLVYNNGELNTKYSYGESSLTECTYTYDKNGVIIESTLGEVIEHDEWFRISDSEVSQQEYEQQFASLEMKQLDTDAYDLTVNKYDACYSDSVIDALGEYLPKKYSCKQTKTDIDGDGFKETVFVISDVFSEWTDNIIAYGADIDYIKRDYFPLDNARSTVIIADTDNDNLVVSSYSFSGKHTIVDEIYYQRGYLHVGGSVALTLKGSILANGYAEINFDDLSAYLRSYGYSDIMFKWADVSDYAGDELLCVCRIDGKWQLMVLYFIDGAPHFMYSSSMDGYAYYLVNIDGVLHLCYYYQNSTTQSNGRIYNNYGLNVFRFDGNGDFKSVDYQTVSYYNDEANAESISAFFDKFNSYVSRLIVIRDPFRITGSLWFSESPTYGSVPSDSSSGGGSSSTPEEEQEGTPGYVSIQDADSWLHLRTGPGTNYDRVLMDPSNPESFVRQAKGAPVTILETIETGDADNPVWVKIRIIYGDRVLVGYSSKTYITVYE